MEMFKSILSNEMTAYLEIRTMIVSEGQVAQDRRALISLDNYIASHGICSKELTEDVLASWISTLFGKSKTIREKVGTVRNFVRYLNTLGNRSFLPDSPKVKSDYIPYIYSDEEVQKIMYYADNLLPRGSTNDPAPFYLKVPMVIRILYGCGTRLGETMALQRKDIDFKAGTLYLKKTKFSKERVIPVHDSLLSILQQYCLTLGILNNPNAFLFPGKDPEHHYTKRQMTTWFSRILRLADIDQRKKGRYERGACLHCFRHLFVLKAMQRLEIAGRPVDMNDLLLPTYLGHNCLIDTDQYLRFSGVLLPETIDAFELFTYGLIPNVEVPYEEE